MDGPLMLHEFLALPLAVLVVSYVGFYRHGGRS